MANLLMSKDNSKRWKLEGLLTTLQDEIVNRMAWIWGDMRTEAQRILQNNAEIISMLGECSLKP